MKVANKLYHGSKSSFKKPKLNGIGIFWLTDDIEAASCYAKEQLKFNVLPIMYEVKLKTSANILDLQDQDAPLVKDFAKYLNDNRKNISNTFKKHKLGGAWWFSFEFLEENLDALDWLAARVSGVLVADTCESYDHQSIALFDLAKIDSCTKITAFKDEVQGAYNIYFQ